MDKTPRELFESFRDEIDQQVRTLHTEEYREFLEELAGDIKCRLDCLRDENPEME